MSSIWPCHVNVFVVVEVLFGQVLYYANSPVADL